MLKTLPTTASEIDAIPTTDASYIGMNAGMPSEPAEEVVVAEAPKVIKPKFSPAMETFYKVNDNTFALVHTDGKVTGFSTHAIIPFYADANFVLANYPEFPAASDIYDKVQSTTLLETVDGIDFYMNKDTFKVSANIGGVIVDIDSAAAKSTITSEKKKLKDFLKAIKKSRESYRMGDRVLLYGPTGTGKTFNFIEFLKTSKFEYTIIPVSEGMEDLDLLNYIVPTATGVTYKPKEITLLLEKAEKWEKVAIIFDELNRGSSSLMNIVLKAIDPVDGKNYYITNVLQDRTYIIPQENIIWWATVNLWGKYTGTNALDEALFDRFNIVTFTGYNSDVERAIIKSAGFDAEQTKKIMKFVDAVRDFSTSGELRSPISTRGIKVWMEEYINNSDLMLSFERTLLYRLVSVDEFGFPNPQELDIVKGKFQETIK